MALKFDRRQDMLRHVARFALSAEQEKLEKGFSGGPVIGLDSLDGAGKTFLIFRELIPFMLSEGHFSVGARGDWSIESGSVRRHCPLWYSVYFRWFNYKRDLVPTLAEVTKPGELDFTRRWQYDSDSARRHVTVKLKAPYRRFTFVEGLFLQDPIVRPFLDKVIWIHTDPDVSRERQIVRDKKEKGRTEDEVKRLVDTVFMPAHMIYHQLYHPIEMADMVIDNNRL